MRLNPMDLAHQINAYFKKQKKEKMHQYLSYVRRVEEVAPVAGRRLVAMTFDDGPTSSPARPHNGLGLTESLLATLKHYNAHGTFDIIGTTAFNYPDKEGKIGTAKWSGIRYDHYPEFGKDELAGAVNQKDLVQKILDEGHELSNHTYRHIAFGPSPVVYGSRQYLKDLAEVIEDLRNLHNLIEEEFGYKIIFSRPPHYIDGTADKKNAYDAYRELGYLYLAASFDGGGWKPSCGNYQKDVEDMVLPLQKSLEADAESLNGKIIFQKDGYNMSKQSPVCDALPLQLKILQAYDYEVVTVRELITLSPFSDLDPSSPLIPDLIKLHQKGFTTGYRDNTFQPERLITRGELAATIINIKNLTPPLKYPSLKDVPLNHPYHPFIQKAVASGLMKAEGGFFRPDTQVTYAALKETINNMLEVFNLDLAEPEIPSSSGAVDRLAALKILIPYLLTL